MCNCNNSPCTCDLSPQINCDPCLSTEYCKDKIDASCVYYHFNDPEKLSRLSCFLDLPSNTNLDTILEKLDEKLCDLSAISDINFVDNDCISWTKAISESGVITIVPIINYTCLINNIAANSLFCQKVEDCAVNPPTCSPVPNIQKISSSTNSLTFEFGTVTGALNYEVKLFTDFTYTTQVGGTQTVVHPTNTVTFTGLSANTAYYVQIRVLCTNELYSQLTSAGAFLTDNVPNVACPSITINSVVVTNNSAQINWTGGVGATSYNVYINNVLQAGMPTASTTFTKNSLPNGNYSVKVEALPCVGVPQSDTDTFNINYNAPSISLNCGSLTQISGSFQQGLASSGTIRIPVTVVGSDLVDVTVSGTGFTGSVTNLIVNSFTTYIDIPVTYNGSAPTGSRAITITVVGSVIPSTNCNGNVNVTCPTCNNPTINISSTNSNGFTVDVSPLGVGDDYDIIIEDSGTPVVTLTGQTVPYVFNTGNPSTLYTVKVTKNCACGNSSNQVTQNVLTSTGNQASIFIYPENDGLGNIRVVADVVSGSILDTIAFNFEVQRYSDTNCTTTIAVEITGNATLNSGDTTASSGTMGTLLAAQTLKIITLIANATAISTSPQVITISGRNYEIVGALTCVGV